MIRKRGKLARGAIIMGSAAQSVQDLAAGMWGADASRRWLVPLAVFLCITGLLLTVAASVEALAPFVYAIF